MERSRIVAQVFEEFIKDLEADENFDRAVLKRVQDSLLNETGAGADQIRQLFTAEDDPL